jgi:hypothetical protein
LEPHQQVEIVRAKPSAAAAPSAAGKRAAQAGKGKGKAKAKAHAQPEAGAASSPQAPPTPATPTETEKPPQGRRSKKGSSAQQLSALDAAAKVLAETGTALTCQELIQVMAAKGYWTSPAGKTPAATLYAAILKEVKTKGAEARFQKTAPGKFAAAL